MVEERNPLLDAWLYENICYWISVQYKGYFDFLGYHLFMNKMIIYLDMFQGKWC